MPPRDEPMKPKKLYTPLAVPRPLDGHELGKKSGQDRLIDAVAEEKRRAADVERNIVLGTEEIGAVADRCREPAEHNRPAEPSGLFGAAHIGKNKEHAGQKNDQNRLARVATFRRR